MTVSPAPRPAQGGKVRVLLFLFLMVPTSMAVAAGYLVLSSLRLHGEAGQLRRALVSESPGDWDKRVEVHSGWFTTWMARQVMARLQLPSEAQQAVRGLRRVEVGVYQSVQSDLIRLDALLDVGDESMERVDWERVVTVSARDRLVAVYAPRDLHDPSRARFAVVVVEENHLVVASGAGSLEPIAKLARNHWERRRP